MVTSYVGKGMCCIVVILLTILAHFSLADDPEPLAIPHTPYALSQNKITIYEEFGLLYATQDHFDPVSRVVSHRTGSCTVTIPYLSSPQKDILLPTSHGILHYIGNSASDVNTDYYSVPSTPSVNRGSNFLTIEFVFSSQDAPAWTPYTREIDRRVGIELSIDFSPDVQLDASLAAANYSPIHCDITHHFSEDLEESDITFSVEIGPSQSQVKNYQPFSRSPQTIEASSYLTRNAYYDTQPKPIRTYVNHHSMIAHNIPDINFFPTPRDAPTTGCQGIGAITITPATPWVMEYAGKTPSQGDPATCILNNKEVLQGTFEYYSVDVKNHIKGTTEELFRYRTATFAFGADSITVTPLEPLQIVLYIPAPLQVILFQGGGSVSIFCPDLQFSAYSPYLKYEVETMPPTWKDKKHGIGYKTAMQSHPIRTQVRFYQHCISSSSALNEMDDPRPASLFLQNAIIAESLPTLSPFFPKTIISNSTWAVHEGVATDSDYTISSSTTLHFGTGFYHDLNEKKDFQDDPAHNLFGFLDPLYLILTVSNCKLDPKQFPTQTQNSEVEKQMSDKTSRFLYYYTYMITDRDTGSHYSPMTFSSSTGASVYKFLSAKDENPRYSVKVDMTKFFLDSNRKTGAYPRFFHFKMKLQCQPVEGVAVTIANQIVTEKQTLASGDDPDTDPQPTPSLSTFDDQNRYLGGDNSSPSGILPTPTPRIRTARNSANQLRAADGNAAIAYNQVTILPPVREAIDFSQPFTLTSTRTTTQDGKDHSEDFFRVSFHFNKFGYEDEKFNELHVKLSFLSDSFEFAHTKDTQGPKCRLGFDSTKLQSTSIFKYDFDPARQTANDITAFFPVTSVDVKWATLFDPRYALLAPTLQEESTLSTIYVKIMGQNTDNKYPGNFNLECTGIHAQSKWVQDADKLAWPSNQDEILLVSVFVSKYGGPSSASTVYDVPDIRRSQLRYNPTYQTLPVSPITDSNVDVSLVFAVILLTLPILLIIGLAVLFWCKVNHACCFKPSYYHPKPKKTSLLSQVEH